MENKSAATDEGRTPGRTPHGQPKRFSFSGSSMEFINGDKDEKDI